MQVQGKNKVNETRDIYVRIVYSTMLVRLSETSHQSRDALNAKRALVDALTGKSIQQKSSHDVASVSH